MKKQKTMKGKKIDVDIRNEWILMDKKENNKGTIKLHAKDTVSWHAGQSALEFSFSGGVNIDTYFEYDNKLFKNGKTQNVKKGDSLSLTVKDDAPAGELFYNIEVKGTGKKVVGNSPPKMIILESD